MVKQVVFLLSVNIKQRVVNYWLKIVTGQVGKLTTMMYNSLFNLYIGNMCSHPWLLFIKNTLNECGLVCWEFNVSLSQ